MKMTNEQKDFLEYKNLFNEVIAVELKRLTPTEAQQVMGFWYNFIYTKKLHTLFTAEVMKDTYLSVFGEGNNSIANFVLSVADRFYIHLQDKNDFIHSLSRLSHFSNSASNQDKTVHFFKENNAMYFRYLYAEKQNWLQRLLNIRPKNNLYFILEDNSWITVVIMLFICCETVLVTTAE